MEKVSGIHAIEEAVKQGAAQKVYISGKGKRVEALKGLCRKNKVKFEIISSPEMDKLAGNRDHKGALLIRKEGGVRNTVSINSFIKTANDDALVMVLDGITDPHNLGAIFRSCDLFGVDLLVLPERRSAAVNETVTRVASGAVDWVPYVIVPNLTRELEKLKENGFWIYGADMGGQAVYDINLTGKTVLIMGSEGKGLHRLVKEQCDGIVSVPIDGHIDSLNVSVAAGVVLYDIKRQKSSKGIQ